MTDFDRIMDGLEDVLRIVQCDHPQRAELPPNSIVTPLRSYHCPDCGGVFHEPEQRTSS